MRFQSSLRLYPSYEHDVAVRDPLWHSSIILEHFGLNCVNFAAPLGVTSLDEITIRCKGRSGAK